MATDVFRFQFAAETPLEEAELTLQLAIFAAEGLFGAARVRLEFGYHVDTSRHAILTDGTTEVGAAVVRVFTGLMLREFGEESFRVEHLNSTPTPPQSVAA